MHYPQRLSSDTSNEKRINHTRSKALIGDDNIKCNTNSNFSSACHQHSGNTPSCVYRWIGSKEEELNSCAHCPDASTGNTDSFSSPMHSERSHLVGSSDESGSEHDADIGGTLNSDVNNQNSDALRQPCVSSEMNRRIVDKDSRRHKGGKDSCKLNLGIHSTSPSTTRSHRMANKALISDQSMPYDAASSSMSHKFLRKGSSSKAPHIDDITAPLSLDKRYRQNGEVFPGEASLSSHEKRQSFPKNRSTVNNSKFIGQSNSTAVGDQIGKKKTLFSSHRVGPTDLRQRNKGNVTGSSHRALSNMMCTSASDVLPSVSASALNNLACSSASDTLPSTSSVVVGGGGHLCPRKDSRLLGLTEGGEASRGICLRQGHSENNRPLNFEQTTNMMNDQSQEQHFLGPEFDPSPGVRVSAPFLQMETRYHRNPVSVDMRMDLINRNAVPPAANRPLAANYSGGNNDRFFRNDYRFESLPRFNNAFLEPIPAFRENLSNQLSNQRGLRRNIYGNQHDPSREDIRNPNRNGLISSSTSSNTSRMHELQYTRPSFSGPPPPARPSRQAVFEVFPESSNLLPPRRATHDSYNPQLIRSTPSPNEEINGHDSSVLETMAFGSSMANDEVHQLLTADSLSEILSALQDIEMDEELSYEQILMLEATILLGGVRLHDRHRDMRIDIDNMSYEELLALEERIGNVNTGLSEESILKCVRTVLYVPPDTSISYAPEDIAIKCTICQEEFEEAVELGVLQCGHSHHITCIKQWLVQKNQCPVCKASVMGDN